MKQWARKALRIALIVALVVSLGVVLWRQAEYAGGRADYAQAEAVAGVPSLGPAAPDPSPTSPGTKDVPDLAPKTSDTELELLAQVDLGALAQVNGDVVGWIAIPGTELSYPLLQGRDNQRYLNYTWQGRRSGVGAIFLDWRCDPELREPYTLIYGHRMHDTSMFGSLGGYADEAYWREHPSVYIVHRGGAERFDIFAAFEARVDSDVYRLEAPAEDWAAFVAWCLEQSAVDGGRNPTPGSKIITLSTCTRAGGRTTRWVVVAAQEG